MPTMTRGNAEIHYEVLGSGYPILMLAAGGMRSRSARWREKEPKWLEPECGLVNNFQLILMDQRNAGRSRAPITAQTNWSDYTDDQLALLDHLHVDRCHLMGGCIGAGPFPLALIAKSPERFTAAVLQSPWALYNNRDGVKNAFQGWAEETRAARPEVKEADLAAMYDRMFGGDFVFSVPASFMPKCQVPLLILSGEDKAHPREISKIMADTAPDAELLTGWSTAETLPNTIRRVNDFLLTHTPQKKAA